MGGITKNNIKTIEDGKKIFEELLFRILISTQIFKIINAKINKNLDWKIGALKYR